MRASRGRSQEFSDLVYECKQLIMQVALSSEINVLGHQLNRLSERDRHVRDFTLNSLTHAIREVIACFPVYRTYIDGNGVTERERTIIETAIRRAKRKNPATDITVFNYLRDILLLRYPGSSTEAEREAQHAFVLKVSTMYRAGHGERRRGYRLLPLPSSRLAQRSRRVARAVRRVARHLSPAQSGTPKPLAVGVWRPQHTIPNAVKMCVHGSMCCPRCRANGAP